MQAGLRLVAMVLAITLAGGAQACLALCASPARAAMAVAPEKPPKEKPSSCHRCPSDKAPVEPAPAEPSVPCKQCQTASHDRLAAERDGSLVLKTAFASAFLPFVELTPATPVLDRSFEVTRLSIHSPPGERLHRFCLLLI